MALHPTFECTHLPCFGAGDHTDAAATWRAAEDSTVKLNTNHLALLHAAAAGQPPANRRLHLGRAHHPRRRRLHLRAAWPALQWARFSLDRRARSRPAATSFGYGIVGHLRDVSRCSPDVCDRVCVSLCGLSCDVVCAPSCGALVLVLSVE